MMDFKKIIQDNLENDFEQDLFNAAFEGLSLKTKFKFAYFALCMRELTRTIFTRLAADEEIFECNWYKNEFTDGKKGVTRKQRMLYAIKGGLSDDFVSNNLGIDTDGITKQIVKSIDNLSKYVHVTQGIYNSDEIECRKMVIGAILSLSEFFISIDECRWQIYSAYEKLIYDKIEDVLNNDVVDDIDILATHYSIDYVGIEKLNVDYINYQYLGLTFEGVISVEHQYGSNRDVKKGDGYRTTSDYPFKSTIDIGVNEPLEIEIGINDIEIDTSKHFE